MVFESLINPINAEKKPWEMFFIGFVYSTIAILLSLFIFRGYASLVMIFLTMLPSIPLMFATIKMEEKKDMVYQEERILIKEHGKALSFFIFMFIGFVVSFSIWYIFLPESTVEGLFETQISEINHIEEISQSVTGNAVSLAPILGKIFFNNLWVMVFSLLFAFFYGVGGIFILTWNASVIGAAVGIFVKNNLASYMYSIPSGLMRYFIHGIPEMLAYFMAGLAGSIISIAIIRHDFGSGKFKHILIDSLDLILLAVLTLFVAALMEIFITPLFF